MNIIVLLQTFLFGCVIDTAPVETRLGPAERGQQVAESQKAHNPPRVQNSGWG